MPTTAKFKPLFLVLILVALLAFPVAAQATLSFTHNPFLFVPPAFDPAVPSRLWYRGLAVVSFAGVRGGLVAAAIVGPG